MRRLEHKIPPPVLVLLALGLTWAIDRLDLDGSPLQGTPARAAALVLAALGLALGASGLAGFLRAGTTFDPHHIEDASALVVTGVYRFTRNPMYLGMVTLSVAWALALGTVVGLVGPVLLVAALARLQIRPEERALAARFGDDYERYRRSVRRWL
jgi:protein-S-isoprenylcysteine O-methyltransferase Ste14